MRLKNQNFVNGVYHLKNEVIEEKKEKKETKKAKKKGDK